ncbi:hypothetical protein MKW92_027587 [Papaver armeniacum]|nr:hypothetical protein MKW92_027587 [Papaver armeniacum]
MASTSAVSMAMPFTSSSQKRSSVLSSDASFLKAMPSLKSSKAVALTSSSRVNSRLQVKASLKEKMISGLTAATLAAYMVMPEVAEAASGASPSLTNFLKSIVAGGVVVGGIIGAVIAVSNFDPVKRT